MNVSPIQTAETRPAPANLRDERDFNQAKRHSAHVSMFRKILPLIALVWGGFFLLTATFSLATLPDISVESAGIEGGKLVMNAPTMSGFDAKNRPYDVKAARAIQDLTDSSVVDLEKINALLPMDEKNKARLTADFGVYNTETETLILKDNILIKGARGMDITLETADINMKTGSMKSNQRVTVKSDDMNISANSVIVENNGDRVVFKNRVMTTIKARPNKN